jgi:hypothetical protein
VPEGTKVEVGLELVPVKSVHELLALAPSKGPKKRMGVVE